MLARECKQAQQPGPASVVDELLAFVEHPRQHMESAQERGTNRLAPSAPAPLSLPRNVVVAELLPSGDQILLLEVAAALLEPATKMVRLDLEQFGVSSRERITARSQPQRLLAERIAKAFGDLRFDLYVDAKVATTPRIVPGDPPSLVLPLGFADLAENEQIASLTHLLAYIALDIPWVEELPADDVDGLLFGALRTSFELWGQGELSPSAELAAKTWKPRLAKTIGRKARRTLDDYVQRVPSQSDTSVWRQAMKIVALRAAYVLTGDLSATLTHILRVEADLRPSPTEVIAAKFFEHPLLRDVALFALSDSAFALRRSVGSL
jgi:hypothetical protein